MKLSARQKPNKAGGLIDLFFNESSLAEINDAIGNLQNKLQACIQQQVDLYRSKAAAKTRVLELCANPRTRKIIAILLTERRGRPRLNKPKKLFAAETLLTNFTIYKNFEAPKKITDADFAEWYLYHSELGPKADQKKLPVSETDIRMLQNRLSKARRLVNHAG
jgi:hypothetical protein